MKKIIVYLSFISMTSISSAYYMARIPLESFNGGHLPNNSIIFKNLVVGSWVSHPRFESNWIAAGPVYDCSNFSPLENTVPIGDVFTQTADCKQNEERTVQDQEINTNGDIRKIGPLTTETRINIVSETRESIGTKEQEETWLSFANANGLGKDWHNIDWMSKSLTRVPSVPYPSISVNQNLKLSGNQLKNVDGLISLTRVYGDFHINTNQLENVDGLINLNYVNGSFFLYQNNLTNVDGLINLKYANSLYIQSNPLTNINGLKNVVVNVSIVIDPLYSGPKLDANTPFCTQNAYNKFQSGFAQKTKLCN